MALCNLFLCATPCHNIGLLKHIIKAVCVGLVPEMTVCTQNKVCFSRTRITELSVCLPGSDLNCGLLTSLALACRRGQPGHNPCCGVAIAGRRRQVIRL